MLLKDLGVDTPPETRYKNMHVSKYPEMCLFLTSLTKPVGGESGGGAITVTFNRPDKSTIDSTQVPLEPDTDGLEVMDINMHKSPTKVHRMPDEVNKWFSTHFGYDVVLVYIGTNTRNVQMSTTPAIRDTSAGGGWLSSLASSIPLFGEANAQEEKITLSDCAPYLVVSQTSLQDVSSRLNGEEMDITKFRPNIVVEGADEPYDEDYWAEMSMGDATLHAVQNCVRCASLNVDYATGKPGTGESGSVLKKLQKDRRVDAGARWSPVFGRYTFLAPKDHGKQLSIGDEVVIVKRNPERTVWGESLVR